MLNNQIKNNMGIYKKILMVCLGFAVVLSGCGQSIMNNDSGKLKVISSIYPIHDVVSNLGGYWVESDVLVPSGTSPHTYDPNPSDVAKLVEADLVFVVGAGLDDWVGKMAESSGIDQEKIIDLSQYVTLRHMEQEGQEEETEEEHHHGDVDPHYWVSPKRVAELTDDVTAVYKQVDSEHASDYDSYLDEYNQEIANLDEDVIEKVNAFTSKDIVVFHDAFSYFADDYGLNIVGVIEPVVGTEPTPQQLALVVENVKQLGVPAVFKEPQLSPDIVEAIKSDLNVDMGVLDPLGGTDGRLTYISLVKSNLMELARFLS